MQVICAWCQKLISEYPGKTNEISHGICPACQEQMFKEIKKCKKTHQGTVKKEILIK